MVLYKYKEKKGELEVNIVIVKFEGTPNKEYHFNTALELIKGGIYEIVADNRTTYDNKVKVVEICRSHKSKKLRTITEAKLIQAPPKPEKLYEKIIVNTSKQIICVIWKDGTKTIMRPQPEDEFDVEKGIALCFMKRIYDNRGCFNDAFKDFEVV